MLILEKAVAKFCGSYATLTYGQPSWALQLLLGPPKMAFYERHPAGPAGMWQQGYLSREKLIVNGAQSPLGLPPPPRPPPPCICHFSPRP